MEPHLNLALALRSNPGAYAILLGAGASVSTGIKQAWEIQRDLINQLRAMKSVESTGDPFIWFRSTYGVEPEYDRLLAELASTPVERQALLRGYFEPEGGVDKFAPTKAHAAIARLAAAGAIRVIVTTNFDHLMESALRAEGVSPTVVANASDAVGMAPLHTQRCVVIHLHGDYLDPHTMLNTTKELSAYEPAMDQLLDRVVDEYGLVIAGWSARWDPALRDAISRCPTRRFTSTWVEPMRFSEEAMNLAAGREAAIAPTTADDFFPRLADAFMALRSRKEPRPVEVSVAVEPPRDISPAAARRSTSMTSSDMSSNG